MTIPPTAIHLLDEEGQRQYWTEQAKKNGRALRARFSEIDRMADQLGSFA